MKKNLILYFVLVTILFVDYFCSIFLAQLLHIDNYIFKSITGMMPDIRGDIMICFFLIIVEGIIAISIHDKRNDITNQKNIKNKNDFSK
ncbi:MAG: hypothetical protein RR847_03010 [Bacilli bacterium]